MDLAALGDLTRRARAEHDANVERTLAECAGRFGTPRHLNDDGALEVTPEQFEAMLRAYGEGDRPGVPRFDSIPVVVVR